MTNTEACPWLKHCRVHDTWHLVCLHMQVWPHYTNFVFLWAWEGVWKMTLTRRRSPAGTCSVTRTSHSKTSVSWLFSVMTQGHGSSLSVFSCCLVWLSFPTLPTSPVCSLFPHLLGPGVIVTIKLLHVPCKPIQVLCSVRTLVCSCHCAKHLEKL